MRAQLPTGTRKFRCAYTILAQIGNLPPTRKWNHNGRGLVHIVSFARAPSGSYNDREPVSFSPWCPAVKIMAHSPRLPARTGRRPLIEVPWRSKFTVRSDSLA